MTNDEIIAAIAASPDMQQMQAAGASADIARAINAQGNVRAVSTLGSYALILASVPNGGALLTTLKQASATSDEWLWAWQALLDGRFDFGLPQALAGWDALSAVGVTPEQVAALKAIPMVPDMVTTEQVDAALAGA